MRLMGESGKLRAEAAGVSSIDIGSNYSKVDTLEE